MKPLLLAAALTCAGCAQQDAALLVTIQGAFRVPSDVDKLVLDVFDGQTVIKHKEWCALAQDQALGCDALPLQPSLSGSVTLVQTGAAHPHIKINAEVLQNKLTVGLGTAQADFAGGKTLDVRVTLTRTQ